jgi:hypothetical protein
MSSLRRLSGIVAVMLAVAVADSCRHATPGVMPTVSPRDSVEGTVSIVGTDFDHRVVLIHLDTGIAVVTQSELDSASLARVAGLEVRLFGIRSSAQSMIVESFVVLRAAKSPVVDGILEEANGRLQLVTSSGITHVLGNPPSPLWQMKGSRVWLGGSLEKGPNTYGLITPTSP